jgi:hypothetical protein
MSCRNNGASACGSADCLLAQAVRNVSVPSNSAVEGSDDRQAMPGRKTLRRLSSWKNPMFWQGNPGFLAIFALILP